MSTNKTQNYKLHTWEPTDHFLRSEVNENFAALDAALQTETQRADQALKAETSARSAALTALEAALTSTQVKLFFGTYTGTGDSERQHISLGVTPKLVIVGQDTGFKCGGSSGYSYSGMALDGFPVKEGLTVEGDGFTLAKSSSNIYFNNANKLYYYMALA